MRRNYLLILGVILLLLTGRIFAEGAAKDSLEGSWQGSVRLSEGLLHVNFHIWKANDGSLKSTLDRPERNEFGVKADVTVVQERKFHFEQKKLGIKYDGVLNEKGYLVGVWRQDGAALPLILERYAP